MKPTLVADEMFPEGAGPYMDLEEVPCWFLKTWKVQTSKFAWSVVRNSIFYLNVKT